MAFRDLSLRFGSLARVMTASIELPDPDPDLPTITVVLSPWYQSAVTYYSIFLALGAARRRHSVRLLFVDCLYPLPTERLVAEVNTLLRAVAPIASILPIECLSQMPMDRDHGSIAAIMIAARNDHKHRQGTENCWIDRERYYHHVVPILTTMAAGFSSYLKRHEPDIVLLPSGVVNGMGLLADMAHSHGARVPTYDAGDVVFMGADACAPQFWDAPAATEFLMTRTPPAIQEEIRAEAETLIANARIGKHALTDISLKVAPPEEPFDIVMPLSIEYDSTNVTLQNLYDSQLDWIVDTIEEMTRRHPNIRIAVRLHPKERDRPLMYTRRVVEAVRPLAERHPGVVLIYPEDDINTSDMVRLCKVVATSGSSVGLDAALQGTPVITVMNSYVADPRCRMAVFPATRGHYFELLDAFCAFDPPFRQMPPCAPYVYYLRTQTQGLSPPATPEMLSFLNFLEKGGDLDSFLDNPDTRVMLDVICEGVNPLLGKHANRFPSEREATRTFKGGVHSPSMG